MTNDESEVGFFFFTTHDVHDSFLITDLLSPRYQQNKTEEKETRGVPYDTPPIMTLFFKCM